MQIYKSKIENLKSKIGAAMKNILRLIAMVTLAGCAAMAEAQQPKKVPRLGFLSLRSSTEERRAEALKLRLRDLGYVEGKNIDIQYRWAEGGYEQLPGLAADLVRLKVDIIVANGTLATQAAKNATTTIPIVMSLSGDPVGSGLVASLAKPGGNVTGLSFLGPELSGKRLELLKEAFPHVRRIAVLWLPGAGLTVYFRETQAAAQTLGLKILSLELRRPEDFDGAFAVITRERPDSLSVLPAALIVANQKRIIDFAAKNRLPAMYSQSDYVDAGGLMSYGPNQFDQFRRAAYYVDRILKGTKPADLPVEQPIKFELIINLKTAKQIGLTIPPNVLARADKVIK